MSPALPVPSPLPPWLDTIFPWTSSFLLHLAFFLLLVFTFFAVHHATKPTDTEQFFVPTTVLNSDSPNPLDTLTRPGTDSRDPAQPTIKDVLRPDGWAPTQSPTNLANMLSGNTSENVASAILGGGGATPGGQGINGLAQGGAGQLAPYGQPSRGGTGGIYIKADGATRIVYILDTSGSMIDVFDYLRKDMKKSVNSLLPIQSFGVVVFSEEASILTNMTRATTESQRDLALKIDRTTAAGQNDYTLAPYKDAFVKAFSMKPQLIYFLADGAFDPQLLDELKLMNKDKKVKINTIAFLSSAENPEFLTLYTQLSAIAQDHHGKFRKVTEKDMTSD